jgi:hypothetical protein
MNLASNKLDATIYKNTLHLDFAVLSQSYKPITIDVAKSHVIELDPIHINIQDFLAIFYPFGDSFGINLQKMNSNKQLFPYVSFLPTDRTTNSKNFVLSETIITHIEADLNISRNSFTTSSLIALQKELSEIKTLCDINCCSVLSSLSWGNISSIIQNHQATPQGNDLTEIALILCVIFVTPHDDILETVIKFTYLINIEDINFQ